MTDTNMESGQQQGGEQGEPLPESSPAVGTQPSAVDVKAIAEALRPVIAEEVKRSGQSVKDKRIAKLQATQEELLAKYDVLLKEGRTPAQARRDIAIDLLLERELEKEEDSVSPDTRVGTRAQGTIVDTKAFLQSIGLTETDPDVTAAYAEHGDDPSELVVRLANIVTKRKQAQSQPPKPAQIMQGGGGTSVGAVTTESLLTEYNNLIKNLPQGEAGIPQMFAAKMSIRKKAAEAKVQPPV